MDNITEKQNPKSKRIGLLSTKEILKIINDEDKTVAKAVSREISNIEFLIIDLVESIKNGGKLFYVGCGTSGRLGVLDAAECPPTFSTSSDLVQGIIAGGDKALRISIENAEDSMQAGKDIIKEKKVSMNDVVIGISASGTAEYVLGALSESNKIGAITAMICCNNIKSHDSIKHLIPIIVGPEIISGSTRLKAGTATKMVLNMISTTTMIKLNKVYNNYMVDLKISNKKLYNRALRIIQNITLCSKVESERILKKTNGNVKAAIVMIILGKDDLYETESILDEFDGNLDKILKIKI